jgi:hypothetical protein
VLEIAKKPPFFFKELRNVLRIDEKPPKTSWVFFFDIEKHAKNVKKNFLKNFGRQ